MVFVDPHKATCILATIADKYRPTLYPEQMELIWDGANVNVSPISIDFFDFMQAEDDSIKILWDNTPKCRHATLMRNGVALQDYSFEKEQDLVDVVKNIFRDVAAINETSIVVERNERPIRLLYRGERHHSLSLPDNDLANIAKSTSYKIQIESDDNDVISDAVSLYENSRLIYSYKSREYGDLILRDFTNHMNAVNMLSNIKEDELPVAFFTDDGSFLAALDSKTADFRPICDIGQLDPGYLYSQRPFLRISAISIASTLFLSVDVVVDGEIKEIVAASCHTWKHELKNCKFNCLLDSLDFINKKRGSLDGVLGNTIPEEAKRALEALKIPPVKNIELELEKE